MSRLLQEHNASQPLAARDSLELGSLASSEHSASAGSSSPSGAPSSRRASFDDDDPLTDHKETRRARMNRSYSVSSAFDFAAPLFPLTSSAPGYTALGDPATETGLAGDAATLERQKSLTFLNGLALVVGLIIGTGIFSSPAQVNRNAGSPGAALAAWTIAGLLAWTGAASYAELGGAIPLNGGAQVYISKIYGDMVGFLYSWFTVCVIKPGGAGIIAIVFGEYIVRAVIGPDAEDARSWINKGVALLGLIVVVILSAISTKVASKAADLFMFFKFVAILGVTITGLVVAATGSSYEGRASVDWKTHSWFEGTRDDLSRWAVAVYAGLWAFDGWDNVNFVAAEFINPTRDLPRVIHTSLPMVIIAYLLANVAYFLVLPLKVTSGSQTIAVAFGATVLGPAGSLILALIVAGSGFGSLNATMFTSSRLFYAAAKEGYLPAVIGTLGFRGNSGIRVTRRMSRLKRPSTATNIFARLCADDATQAVFMTPVASLALNFVFSAAYIVIGNFSTLVTFYGVATYFFYFLTVLGLLILRVKEPHLERPYKCWITTPIIFCCVSLFLLSRSFVAEPWTSFAVIPFFLIGAVVYWWKVRLGGGPHGGDGTDWRFWKRWGRS
ncbi:MAG: hypothetical protein Q9159_005080 [Coniocarpon cinnabarinum]